MSTGLHSLGDLEVTNVWGTAAGVDDDWTTTYKPVNELDTDADAPLYIGCLVVDPQSTTPSVDLYFTEPVRLSGQSIRLDTSGVTEDRSRLPLLSMQYGNTEFALPNVNTYCRSVHKYV